MSVFLNSKGSVLFFSFFPAAWLRKGNPTHEPTQTHLNHWSHYPDSWMHQLISSNILSRVLEMTGDLSQELLSCLHSIYGIICATTSQKLLQLIPPSMMTPIGPVTPLGRDTLPITDPNPERFSSARSRNVNPLGQLPKTACLEKNNITRSKKTVGWCKRKIYK